MLAAQSPLMHQREIGSPNSKIAVDDLDPDECEKILQVLQKDFELRQKEKERLERIEEDVNEEKSKIEILAKKTKLNENVCIRCCQTFGIIFNRRQTCQDCKLFVCKSCCDFNKELKGYVCKICTSERELKMKSCDWFYNNVSKKFKRFGSAKIVRTLYMHQRDSKFGRFHSDNESDSGYDPSLYNSLQKGSLQSPRVKQRGHVTSVFPDPESVSRPEDEIHPEGEGETTAVIPPDSSSSYVAIKTKTGDKDSDSETGPRTQNGLTRLNDALRAADELDGRCEDDDEEEEEEEDNVLPEQSCNVMSSREITRDSLTDTDDGIAMVTYDDMFGSDENQAIDSILPPPPLFDIHQLANSPTNINNQLSPRNLTDKLNAQNADLNNHNNNNVVVDTSDLDTLLDNKHSIGVETTLSVKEQNSVGIETENFVPECHSIGTETASRGVNQNSVTTETCCPDLRDTQTDTNSLLGGPEDTRSDPDWKENKTNEIYREALEKTQHTEGKKFNNKFSDFLADIKESLENQTPGAHGKTSYGGVAVSYTNRLRDILIGLSQRLEIAIDSFDRKSSPEDVNSKVKHLVTALVERSLGESLDFTADEAVSDLSSLSGEDEDNHRGFEDGLAQAVVSKVLESYRQEHGLGPLNLSLDSDLESRSRDKPSQRSKWNRTSHTQKDSGVDLDHPDPRRRRWVKGQRADIYSDSDSIGVGDFDAESDYSDRGDRHLRSGQGQNQGSDRLRSKGQGPFPAPRSKRTAINKQWSQSEGNIYDLDPNSSCNHKSRSLNSSRSSYSEYDSDTVDAKERSARRSWDKPQAPFKGSELDFSYSENEEVYKTHNNKAKGVNHSSRSRGVSSLSDGEFRDTRHGYEYDDSDSGRPQRKDRTSRNSVPHGREPNGDLRRRSNSGNSQLTDKPRKSDINDPYSSSGRKNTSHGKKRVPDVSDSDLSFNQSFSDPEEDSSFQEEEAIGHIRAALASESVTSLESCHQTPNLRTAAGAASDEDTVKEGGSEGEEEEEETEAGESHDQELAESDPEDQIQNLKSFLQNIHPRREIRQVEPEEEVVCVEEPSVEAVHVDRTEQQDDFLTKYSSISHAQEHQPPLPAFDLDLDLPNEIDPDLLSMNLAPILEEEEEEEEDEEEIDEDEDEYGDENEKMHNKSWRRNWIFNSSVSAYDNLGKKKIGSELGEVYMALPSIYTDIGPKVGNRDADELSDLSENDHLNGQEMEDELANLSDEENSFYARTSEEIARITRKPSSVHSTSIQTDDSELDTSKETFSDVKGQSSKASSSSEEAIRKKKKLLEELIPAEGDDPRFEIPPESVTVSEGESAKFTCRVGGTGSIEVFWYRVEEDMQELQNSQQYEVTREGNRSNLVVYFPSVKDAGQYMAIAIGEKGKCCQYLVLNVKKNTQELKAPEFIRGIADVETSEGRSAKFRCKVKGYPQPRVVWYKDGILLKSENNVKIEKFGNRDYILTVDNITMDDDAEYTVAAKNIAGEVKSCAQLLVDTEANRVGGSPKESTRLFLSHSSVSEDNTPNLSDIGDDPSQDSLHVSSFSRRLLSSRPSMPLHSQGEKKDKPKSATSAALKVLNSTQEAVESLEGQEQDLHCLATSTPRIEDEEPLPPYSETIDSPTAMSPYQRIMDTPTSGGRSGQPKSQMQVNVIQNASSAKPVIKVDITKSETLPSSSEITLTPQVLEEKGLNSSTSFSSDEIDYAAASYDVQANPNTGSRRSESRIVVNLGPKKERTEAYSKEFYTPVVPKDQHKHWEVETTPHVAGEVVNRKDKEEASKGANANKSVPQISIATPNIKLRKVEETLSQEPILSPHGGPQNTSPSLGSKTVTVTPLFQKTSPVKPIVEEKQTLSFQTPSYSANPSTPTPIIRVQEDRPLATSLKGHTGEDELPESRTELNEEAGVQLPSVNHLKAMFSRVHKADDSSVKRVHSITGRSIPAEQRNKYRRQNSSGSDDPAHSSPNSQSEGSLAATLTPAPVNTHLDPTQIFPRERGHLFPESDRLTNNPQNSLTSQRVLPPSSGAAQTSAKKHKAPEPPTNKSHDTSTTTSGSHDPSQAGTTGEPSRKDGEQDGVAKRAPRIRSGCIAARASFWEKRIVDPNDVNDNEFPSMIEN